MIRFNHFFKRSFPTDARVNDKTPMANSSHHYVTNAQLNDETNHITTDVTAISITYRTFRLSGIVFDKRATQLIQFTFKYCRTVTQQIIQQCTFKYSTQMSASIGRINQIEKIGCPFLGEENLAVVLNRLK